MKKKIEDYMHLYLGCELWYLNKVHKFCGKSIDGSKQVFVHLLQGKTYFVNLLHEHGEMQLILRPLSDMSEEEKKTFWEETVSMHSPNFIEQREREAKRTNWLRKNFFDVDGLIEAGLAIDKTTLK